MRANFIMHKYLSPSPDVGDHTGRLINYTAAISPGATQTWVKLHKIMS